VGTEPIRKITLSDGSVRYRVVVNAGRKPDGSRAQRTSTHRTRREAREWLAAVRSDMNRGTYVALQRTTLNEHLDTWLEGKRDIRPATRRSYVDGMKPVRQMLGHKLLQDVTKADVEALVTSTLTTGGRQGQGRSPRTVTMMLVVLQQAMQDAVRQGLIVRNVVSLVQKPRQVHHEMSAWTLEQTRTFLAHVADDRLYAAWLLTMHGLRRGEVLGLRWSDLTLDGPEPTLAVRQTRVLVHASVVTIGEPKTARGRRMLPLPAGLVTAMRALQDRQAAERRLAGTAYQDTDLVVVDELGRPIRLERYGDAFRRHARDAGLPEIRLHDARHTAASLMLALGYPVHVVAAWLGHDPVMTQRVYAHVHAAEMRSLGEAFGQAITRDQ
jgi:integrase